MAQAHILGWPRIGARREWKFACEAFGRGDLSELQLRATAQQQREGNWRRQNDAGLRWITAGDFAYHDHMLSQSILLGAVPARFGFDPHHLTPQHYFELARGNTDNTPMPTAQWFGTRYRYVVPELDDDTHFNGTTDHFFEEIQQAQAGQRVVKPVLIGPVSYLWLAGASAGRADRLRYLPALLDRYFLILRQLAELGVEWIQLDEPMLCHAHDSRWRDAIQTSYRTLTRAGLKILLATYFGDASQHVRDILTLPVQGVHIDCVSAPRQLRPWLDWLPPDMLLSAGIIDATNVWRGDLRRLLNALQPAQEKLGDRLLLAPSASLLHVPVSLGAETGLDPEIRSWFAFAEEKLAELAVLTRALNEGESAVSDALEDSDRAQQTRRHSPRLIDLNVRRRLRALPADQERRRRQPRGPEHNAPAGISLGALPATSHGRHVLAARLRGDISETQYRTHRQTELHLALKHRSLFGESNLLHKRTQVDETTFFAERLHGFLITAHGWVQNEGADCVKPPIIVGDISRAQPLLSDIVHQARGSIDAPIHALLTGPLNLLNGSFVRDETTRDAALLQLALALRDEIAELERAGVVMMTIDETAPDCAQGHPCAVDRLVQALQIVSGGARNRALTGVRLSYARFVELLPHIAALDADKIIVDPRDIDGTLPGSAADVFHFSDSGPQKTPGNEPPAPMNAASMLERAGHDFPLERVRVESGDDWFAPFAHNEKIVRSQISEAVQRIRAQRAGTSPHA